MNIVLGTSRLGAQIPRAAAQIPGPAVWIPPSVSPIDAILESSTLYPHAILTSDHNWDPTILDNEIDMEHIT